jgi:outer membrane PBP1 activator LpoA protein
MTKPVRYFVLIVFCLMSVVLAGPVSAACATDLGGSFDSPSTMQSVSAGKADCDMGHNKVHKCSHDAGCGYQLAAISEAGDFSALPAPRAAAVASVTKRLTASSRKPLLDPPRA